MIVEFSVKNFRSIKELQTISFAASSLGSSAQNSIVDENNLVGDGNQKLLKTIGIYGANASGKSNIIQAFGLFCQAIANLPSPDSRLSKLAQPFLYQENSEKTECYFQIVLILNEKKYRYGFTVKKNPDFSNKENLSQEIITAEWLFGAKNKNQGKFFTRKDLIVDKSGLEKNKNIANLSYQHTLFLTHTASYIQSVCSDLRHFVRGYIATKFGARSDFYRFHTIGLIEDERMKSKLLNLFGSFGLYYKDIYVEFDDDKRRNDEIQLDKVFLLKSNRSGDKDIVLNMQEHESDGTKKMFDIAGLLTKAFYGNVGGLVIIDEIDSNFHPSLLIKLVEMFNDPKINKANSQLLFTSHDTNLMSPNLMRRDQFYFTEKNIDNSTKTYSLAELKGIRNDADFAKHYLAGFYGGLPILSNYLDENQLNEEGALES